MIYHQTNDKISSFCNRKLCIRNKLIDRIVNNIQFERNLICMLKTQGTWNLIVIFSKFTKKEKKEIYEKFEEKLCSSVGAHGPSKILKLFYFMYSY